MPSELQEHSLLWQKLFGQYHLPPEALESGAGAGLLFCEEAAPAAPPSPVVCGFSGLLAAREGNAVAAQAASPRSLQTCSSDVKKGACSRQHVRGWVLQNLPKDLPRPVVAPPAHTGAIRQLL